MIPQIEIYLNTECNRPTDAQIERYRDALQELVAELLLAPPGPDHVLSNLDCVEISLVDDETIARIHAEFLDDPTPTDAITFHHGEIIVSIDTAERYAQEHGIRPEEELFRYMVHGLIHLHGYLDYEPTDREALFAVQEPLVARFFPKKD